MSLKLTEQGEILSISMEELVLDSCSLIFLFAETKNQWARDDPAFVVICILLLAFSTLAYCAA